MNMNMNADTNKYGYYQYQLQSVAANLASSSDDDDWVVVDSDEVCWSEHVCAQRASERKLTSKLSGFCS